MIPRIIHRIWLGGNEPCQQRDFADAWARMNPGWVVHTWRDWTLPPLANQDAFDSSRHLAQRSDLARLEIIARHGGVYVDTDVEPLRPIESHLDGIECFVAREDAEFVGTAIMGSVPGHPFFARLIEMAPRSIIESAGMAPNRQTGPYFVTAELQTYARSQIGQRRKVVVFPPEMFYPYHFSEPHRRHDHFPDAVAVHHWSGSWTADESNIGSDSA